MTDPVDDDPPPDLQALVRKAGMRRAAELDEVYDVKNANHGGYPHITKEKWAEHDAAMAAWQTRRRDRYRKK